MDLFMGWREEWRDMPCEVNQQGLLVIVTGKQTCVGKVHG